MSEDDERSEWNTKEIIDDELDVMEFLFNFLSNCWNI